MKTKKTSYSRRSVLAMAGAGAGVAVAGATFPTTFAIGG